jgi:molybdate transport system ATP-binding protein
VLRPQRGRIVADGTVLFDSATKTDVPVHQRGVGYVFQEARLFPHYSVRGNLTYGYERVDPARRYVALDDVVALLGLTSLLDRRPDTLSGGEMQRVAIGRALLTSPRVLLLDEPLSSLDVARKAEIMPYLERLAGQLRVPMIYVSHDPAEIAHLAHRVVHMVDGKVTAITESAQRS